TAWYFVKAPSTTRSLDAVLRLAEKAVALEPENFFFQNTYGAALYRINRHEETVRCLEKNVEHSQQFAAFDLYFLAMSCAHLGQAATARAYFARANAAVKAEASLSAEHRAELAAFRSEAERVLGVTEAK